MDLRPMSYEEMCQMELLHAAAGGAVNTSSVSTANVPHSSVATNTATMLPIMVIPTTMMPPGTAMLTTAAAAAAANSAATTPLDANAIADVTYEHFYQLQPTHILATTTTAAAAASGNPLLIPTEQQQHPHFQQQQPLQQQLPQTVNILYTTGTLTKPQQRNAATNITGASLLTRKALESSFATVAAAGAEETDDFEGSECGASVSSATCIPHFRFGGCGMILQPHHAAAVAAHHQHQQQQQHQQHMAEAAAAAAHHNEAQVIGCGGSFTHMMGSFAAAAGGAMHHSGRLAGTLAGVSAGLTGTLGRNRRSTTASSTTDGTTQTPKRVSFKGDLNLPPEELQEQVLHGGAFNNCSYMNFDNFMDYQTTGFGGLPDVTEHSNIRRTNNTLSRQNSLSNSDSGGGGSAVGIGIGIGGGGGGAEIASIQKTKTTFADVKSAATTTTTASMSTSATLQRSSKKHGNSGHAAATAAGVEHYKSRRATCIFGLTLLVALALLAVAATLATQHFFMAPSRNSHAQRLRIVRRVLKEVPLVDGHNNFAGNVRKYAHSSLELVHLSHDLDHKSMWTRPTWAQTDMERLKQGLIGVQVWSAFVPCEAQGLDAVQLALEQIDIIRRFADMYSQDTLLVASSKDIALARRRGLMASLIGIEGGHAIGSSLGVLRSFYSLGARYLSLTHKCDVSWAGSSSSPLENGLTQFGKSIIREMNRLGMMIDLSYSSDATARDVLEATRAPVIFSHSAARQLCNSTRNIPDDILRLVAENGGLIMVSFDPEDVACGRQAQLSDVVDHIKYIRSIAGIQHIGLGAGYDGIEQPPIGLEDVSKYPDLLATLLEDHNWSEEDVAMLAGKNFMRIMETVENVRDYWKRAAIQPIEQTEPQPKTQCTYMTS